MLLIFIRKITKCQIFSENVGDKVQFEDDS